MTKYLIALIIATTIYVALTVASYYTKYRKGKSFELLNHITQLSSAFVWISIGNWQLDRFFDGENSATGWWLLAFIIGAFLTACLNALVLKCCEKIWPKDQDVVVKSMKMSDGMRMVIHIMTACICLAFVVFFCYGLLLHRAEMSISDIVLISFGAILFAAGTIDNSLRIIRFIKKRQSR